MSATSNRNKPPRIRAACTSCHTGKVRCSGERDGCKRCSELGIDCQYDVSMVGRMSTKRSKRKGKEASKRQQQYSQEHLLTEPLRDAGDEHPVIAITANSMAPDHLPTTSDLTVDELPSTMLIPEFPPVLANEAQPTSGSGGSQSMVMPDSIFGFSSANSVDFASWSPLLFSGDNGIVDPFQSVVSDVSGALENNPPASSSLHREPIQPAQLVTPMPWSDHGHEHTQTSMQQSSTGASSHGLQPLTLAMRLVYALEESLQQSQQLAIGGRLNLNKAAMAQLRVIIAHEAFETCASCILLVTTAIDLILRHFSHIIDYIKEQDHALHSSSSSSSTSGTEGESWPLPHTAGWTHPSLRAGHESCKERKNGNILQIGCFELDQEDQVAFRNHIIRNQLQRCVEIAQSCSKRRTSNPSGLSSSERVRAVLETETEAFAKRLMSSL